MSEKIVELAFVRNTLLRNKFDQDDRVLLDKVKNDIACSSSVFKDIAINAIDNCYDFVARGDFESAALEIDLIHNFTFSDPSKWNQKYFYVGELHTYIERTKDVSKIKNLIYLLGQLPRNI